MKWLRWIFLAALVVWGTGLLWALYAQLTLQVCSAGQPLQAMMLATALFFVAVVLSSWTLPGPRRSKYLSLFLACPCSLFFALFGVVPMETVFVLNPSIDTRSASDFSSSAFAQIEPGFTAAEVLELVGEPLFKQERQAPGSDLGPTAEWTYSVDGACSWCDAAYRHRAVIFVEGVVVKTREQWFCN